MGGRLIQRLARFQLVETLSHLWPYMKPEWRMLSLAAAATLGLTVVELAVPILIGVLINSLVGGTGGQQRAPVLDFRVIVALLAAAALMRGYFLYQQRSLAGQVGQKVTARMRNAVWAHLQELPLEYTSRRGPGRLLVRFISDSRAIQRLVSRRIVELAQDVLVVTGVMAVLIYINLFMGLAALLMLPLIALIFWRLNPELQEASRDTRKRRTRLSARLYQRISGLSAVKGFGRQREETRYVKDLNRKIASKGSRQEVVGGRLLGASAGAVALVTALVIGLAAYEITAGRLRAGDLFIFYTLIALLTPIFQRITIADRTLQEAEISVQRLAQTLAEVPESLPGGELPKLEVGEGFVSVKGASFDYPDGTLAIRDVSLEARRGELVALVGPSGAGKSTLLELLPLFRKPTAGRVVIDGQDTAGVSLKSLRSRIGLVAQDTPLFDGTIAENVAYGVRGDDAEDRIDRVARLSGVDELVASLPDGWETKIREGKREISRGERLRVVLARALAADPPILLLDDVGSVLDPGTLRDLARHKTVIVATHDASSVPGADRIYRLDRGRITEEETGAMLARSDMQNGSR